MHKNSIVLAVAAALASSVLPPPKLLRGKRAIGIWAWVATSTPITP